MQLPAKGVAEKAVARSCGERVVVGLGLKKARAFPKGPKRRKEKPTPASCAPQKKNDEFPIEEVREGGGEEAAVQEQQGEEQEIFLSLWGVRKKKVKY